MSLKINKNVSFSKNACNPLLLTRGTSGLYFQVSGCPNFQTPAKPASDWLEKKLARGKLWQNPRDELQNIEFNQSSAKLCIKLCQSPAKALHESPYKAL